MRPPGVFNKRPKMAMMGLKVTSVTPIVNKDGGGGVGGGSTTGDSTVGGSTLAGVVLSVVAPATEAVASVDPAAATGFGAAGFAVPPGGTGFGSAAATTTTVYLLNSNSCFKKSVRSFDTFFSTMAHLTPSNSSNSWFLLIAIILF